jgi:hypothetical protein
MEGDIFQGMFFWLQAARLLLPASLVNRVVLEHDQSPGVDDVVVYYDAPGINAGGFTCGADFYQIKYHVDRSNEYSVEAFCDPDFIGKTRSLLQSFYHAHRILNSQGVNHRLHLVSNWDWSSDDPIGPLLRESKSGALPDIFFTAGSRSDVGKARAKWRDHLGLEAAEFNSFARRLCLGVNYFARREFRDYLNVQLRSAGLRGIPADRRQDVYDALYREFIIDGPNEFDRASFRAMCEQERLINNEVPSGPPVFGIRSFLRFAENMENECQRFVCVAEYFDGRYIRDKTLWDKTVRPEVETFLSDPALRKQEHHLLLDCHGTLAFLAGYELDRKSGARVFPVQKGVETTVWKPTGPIPPVTAEPGWRVEVTDLDKGSRDIAFSISVTHDITEDARECLGKNGIRVVGIINARPVTGVGSQAITSADHAVALANELAEIIRDSRPLNGGVIHLFGSTPNALLFFLGQHRGWFGEIQLYEFDFDGLHGGSYTPSILFS